ncbi:MAG TPA: YetF domain-containing protein [Gemmatimonadales bacterium]|nr:YetF domain-containing protein [Gemmatimonadales bacterium]
MFFDGWESVARIALLACCTYVVLVLILRVLGEQALAKMSAYDLVVTIALGSIAATIPLSADVTVADGLTAIIVYLLLQQVTRWAVSRSQRVTNVVKDKPHIVFWKGKWVPEGMRAVTVTQEEVRAAARMAGHSSLQDILAIVLENDGSWSVVPRTDSGDLSAFDGLDLPRNIGEPRDNAPGGQERASRRRHPAQAHSSQEL